MTAIYVTYKETPYFDHPVLVARHDGNSLIAEGKRSVFPGKWRRIVPPEE